MSTHKKPLTRLQLKQNIVAAVACEMGLHAHWFTRHNANIPILAKGRQAIAISMHRSITGISQAEIGEYLGNYSQRRVSQWIADGQQNPEVMELVDNAANFEKRDFETLRTS